MIMMRKKWRKKMGLFSFIGDIFKPAVDLVDELNVSDEERGKLKNELAKIQAGMHSKSIELMSVEAKSDHFIVAAWRPICALILFGMILLDGFAVIKAPAQVYQLAELFLGIYGGGRSIEKVARIIKK